MATFITVLNSDLGRSYWSAVQKADSEPAIKAMTTYQAGNSFPFDKKANDRKIGEKQIQEATTGTKATATMFELAAGSTSVVTTIKHQFNMISKKLGFSLVLLAMTIPMLTGCTTNGHLTRRYKSFEIQSVENIGNYVQVQAYVIEKDKDSPTPKKSVFDLSPQAQKELIYQFGHIDAASAKIIDNLTKPLSVSPSTPAPEFLDYTQFEKRVIVTLRDMSHFPADRISKANIMLTLDNKVRLLSCNRLATEFQSIDLGKLDFSNSLSGELSANLGAGFSASNETDGNASSGGTNTVYTGDNTKFSGSNVTQTANGSTYKNTNGSTSAQGLTGKLSASRSFAEEVLLKQRIVSLNASISENTLSLFQESISGIDLTGNIIADIVFDGNSVNQDVAVKKVFSFSDLLDATKKINAPDKITTKETFITYYNFNGDITATLTCETEFRHVSKGDKTITESDDNIILYTGTYQAKDSEGKPSPIIILKKSQLMPTFFALRMKDPAASTIPVFVHSPTGTQGELLFANYDDGKDFFLWLSKQYTGVVDPVTHQMTMAIGNYTLIFPAGFSKMDELALRVWN